jgi:thiol-disulfide isomerase/thioredoxin
MKHLTHFSLIFLFLLTACSTETTSTEVVETTHSNQIVSGKLTGGQGKTMKLVAFDGQKWTPLSSTTISENGEFHLTAFSNLLLCQLVIENSSSLPLVLSGKDSIYITADYPELTKNFTCSNVTYADELNAYMRLLNDFNGIQQHYTQLIQQQAPDDTTAINRLTKTIVDAKKPLDEFALQYIQANPTSALNQLLASQLYPTYGMQFWDEKHLAVLEKMIVIYTEEYPNAYYTRAMSNQIESWKNALDQYKKYKKRMEFYKDTNLPVEIGNKAPDILLETPDGTELKLSSLKGQYVLLDFWASWCGPCRRENPNVVRLYNQYKDKGFTVFSVSLDDNKEQWIQAIQRDNLSWPNHVSDLMKWNSIVVQLYKFSGIPHTVLIDKNGNIIGKNLRGIQLEQKLAELFGK